MPAPILPLTGLLSSKWKHMRSLRLLVSALTLSFVLIPASWARVNYVYVANNQANTVSVINTSSNLVVTTIPVGTNPWGVAVNQAGSFVYITNQGSNNVSVISTSTNTVTATIPVGIAPSGIAFAPNGQTAYVAKSGSNSISVIKTSTKLIIATIPVQTYPYGIAVTPNGGLVYVANFNSKSVSVISTATNKVVATISVGTGPSFLAISPNGSTIYVPNNGSNTISVIRISDNTVVNTINVEGAWGAAVSPDGQWLYSTDYTAGAGNLVTVIDTSTDKVSTTIVVGQNPLQAAFSQDSGFAYVTSSGGGDVAVINTASQTVVDTIAVGTHPVGAGMMGTAKVSTLAGGYVGDGGQATAAALGAPSSTVQDKAGNYYISDSAMNRIRKVTPAGIISTFAGTGLCGYNGDNIPANKAMLCYPAGLTFDSAGNLYVGDSMNARVRRIDTHGKISTVAGSGVAGYSGDGGSALNARLNRPWDIALDSGGNLYFSELGNHTVRKVSTSGIIATYAGTGIEGFSGDGGPGPSAQLAWPYGLAFDASGNLYIGDSANHRIRIVSPGDIINTFAVNCQIACNGDGGPAINAAIALPIGISINNSVLRFTSYYGCDWVRSVDLTTDIINIIAGSSEGYDGDNHPPFSSRFFDPTSSLLDPSGNLFISDSFNGRVRDLSNGVVTTFAGGYLGDGSVASSSAFIHPEAVSIDKSNNFYIADSWGNRVRKVSGGKTSTVAGTGINGYSGDGGLATSALLYGPQGVAVDSFGNVFIADTSNNVIRKVDTTGKMSTFAANPNFCQMFQMTTDSANNLYVADFCTSVVFKISSTGTVSIVAGLPFVYGYNGDNIAAVNAELSSPTSVAFDKNGNMFIADSQNSRIRMVDTSGIIHTIAGDGKCNYSGDGGLATSAELCQPWSVAVSSSGTIYFSDISYARVRKISNGIISAFVGSETLFNGDGLWPLLTALDDPVSLAVDSKGAVYVVDDIERRVRKIQ